MKLQRLLSGGHQDLPRWITVGAFTMLGPAFAWLITEERWKDAVTFVVVALLALFLRWPMVSALGLYALVVPFDSVAAIDAVGGATFVKLAGLLAVCVIAATALVRRRLTVPPRAALWWAILLGWGILSAAWAVEP